MANVQYVRKNRIRQEMAADKTARRRKVLYVGGPLALLLTAFAPTAFFIWFGILGAALLATWSYDPIREAGAAGEDYTLSVLRDLPDEYIIFNQLEVPDDRSRTGVRELDFVVCGPNGIFVIESKNHNGELEGDENDQEWTVHKIGRRGGEYSSTVRNPVRQVKQQVHVLGAYLKGEKVLDWICGVVALSRNNDLSGIASSSVPVMRSVDVTEYILAHGGRGQVRNLDRAVTALAKLTECPAETRQAA